MRCCRADNDALCTGITLIETLLASALGALLLAALLNLYQRGAAMHAFTENRSELNETVFTAEQILADELHLAADSPCGAGGARFNLLRGGATTPWLRLFTEPVQITAGTVSGSDRLTVLKTGAPVLVAGHDSTDREIVLTHAADFENGDLVVVCDGTVAALLQVTRTEDSGRVLKYAHYRFAENALVAPYRPVVFFIEDYGNRRALHRRQLVVSKSKDRVTAKLRSEEMIENIELLKVRAGVADPAQQIRLTRHAAGKQVVGLDIGFAAAARHRNAEALPNTPLHLLGEPVGAWLPGADGRALTTHEFSVALFGATP